MTILPLAGMLALSLGSGAAEAARDRTPPTTPTQLRVTGVSSYSVSLAWNPSRDNSGRFSYVICCAYTNQAVVGQAATTFNFTSGLEAGRSFTLRIYAVDAAGNYSAGSNSVTVQLPPDRTPPTKPLLSVTSVGATHVALAWSANDDSPNLWFQVYRDGRPVIQGSRSTSAIIPLLEPATPYTFAVQAVDFGRNASPLSDTAGATTNASDPNDTSPPTTPGNFRESNYGCETELRWDEASDDLDAPFVLKYEVFVNDVLDHSLSLRATRTIVYGTVNGPNTFAVVAVDTAGNRSTPASVTASLDCVP
jgi:hypothetical protein